MNVSSCAPPILCANHTFDHRMCMLCGTGSEFRGLVFDAMVVECAAVGTSCSRRCWGCAKLIASMRYLQRERPVAHVFLGIHCWCHSSQYWFQHVLGNVTPVNLSPSLTARSRTWSRSIEEKIVTTCSFWRITCLITSGSVRAVLGWTRLPILDHLSSG